MSSSVVTRFAPSPTGYLHIGGARTALFNWLYARGRQGKFLLRIEDTDRARHNAAAVDAIIDGLSWLGIDWDGDPVSQYSRRDRHADVANELLARGAAYRCYMSTDEIEAARLKAIETKSRFESPWRDAPTESAPANRQFTIRFRAPRDGETEVHDSVQGDVKFPNSALDDLIILRSDGAPTYNLAVVVDDHDMGVTHVIRGDDHLNNAARQQQIYRALDWALPSFSHVPLIHGPDGAKLSKRHGALGVDAYRDLGFLPEGVCNYLLRLGWSHGDDEIIPREKALAWFDVAGINRAPARLDLAKMAHTNAHYMKLLDDQSLVEKSAPFFEKAGVVLNDECRARLVRAAGFLKNRSATLAGVVEAAAFLFLPRPVDISGKAGKPLAKEGAQEHLREVYEMLKTLPTEPRYPEMPPGVIGLMAPIPPPWADPVALDEKLKSYAEKRGINFGEIGPALRVALTAGLPSPSLGEVLHGLGTAEALGRILDAISL